MRMRLFAILLLVLSVCGKSYADHVVGGELLYTYLSGQQYLVTLHVYGECSGATFPKLMNAQPRVDIFADEGRYFTLVLNEDVGVRKEITNICPSLAGQSSCINPQGTVPGVVKFTYKAIATLPPSKRWRMLFGGRMDISGKLQTGYSSYISNTKNNTGYGQYLFLEATLNNSDANNSSPVFSTDPTPTYCVNHKQLYSPGAADADGDRLAHSMVPPLDINGISTEYIFPYSAQKPFATQGNIFFDGNTGQMSFTPSLVQVALVVTKTEEYRGSTLVGSCMRALTFFMRDNCNNDVPTAEIVATSVKGAVLGNNLLNTCDGNHPLEFTISVKDVNRDDVHVTLQNLPPGSYANIIGNGTDAPAVFFTWNMQQVPAGAYTFYARYDDESCPMPGVQVTAYTINIADMPRITHEVVKQTNCKDKQQVAFHASGGLIPRKVTITDDRNRVIKNYVDYNGIIKDSFDVGSYIVNITSDNLPCSSQYSFTVKDTGIYPLPPFFEDLHQCLGETPYAVSAVPADGGTVHWYNINGTILPVPPAYTTDSIRHFMWLVNQKVKVCESVFDTFDASVHPYPDIKIQNTNKACLGDGIELLATGGVRYEWQPADKIDHDGEHASIKLFEPTTITVKGFSQFGCGSNDTLVYDYIEPCCKFSYPDAFTPNNDGFNDGWHPVSHGNVDYYLLSVYNRWGERIYTSSDPHEKWDGTYAGKPCDMGSYSYQLKARCVTGSEIVNGGLFILLR